MKGQKTLALVGLVASPLGLALATVAAPKLGVVLITLLVFGALPFVASLVGLAFGLIAVGGLARVFGSLDAGGLLLG